MTFLATFSKAQVSSATATGVDFGLLFFLTEIAHVYYVASVAIGAAAGAITNFLMNRHWSFRATQGSTKTQVYRYAWVSGVSLILNTAGVYGVTEYGSFRYGISVVLISLFVGLAFNYPMHRYYVFKTST